MKRKQALIAAALMTALVAFGLVAVGVNAAINPNSVPVSNSPSTDLAASVSSTSAEGQINQLKTLISQYQAREKQYQQQLSTINGQMQQVQSVLVQLQQAGLITIQNDGSITLGRNRGTRGQGQFNDDSNERRGGGI
jgi:hypothetical protein